MLYLASRFVWFLLAALVLGLAMGWIGQSGRDRRFWSGGWTVVAALWILGAALAWFQFVNGMAATWLETALLFAAVYWLGCAAGGVLHGLAAVPVASPRPIAALPPPPKREALAPPAAAPPS